MAAKEEKNRNGGSFDGHTTLRRTHNNTPKQSSASLTNFEAEKIRKQLSDPGYSIDASMHHTQPEKSIWSAEMDNKWPLHISVDGTTTPSTMSPSGNASDVYDLSQMDRELKRSVTPTNTPTPIKRHFNSETNSNDTSPEADSDSPKTDEKFKSFGNVQTYREYKEALRQQRNQDSSSIYRPKDQTPTPTNGNTLIGDTNTKSQQQNLSPTNYSNQNSPIFLHNKTIITEQTTIMSPNHNGHSPLMSVKHQNQSNDNSNAAKTEETIIAIVTSPTSLNKKPVQKVTPSRNMNAMTTYKNSNVSPTKTTTQTTSTNGNASGMSLSSSTECDGYVKPKSPTHMAGSYYSNTMPASTQSMSKIAATNKAGTQKPNRYVQNIYTL